MKVPAFLAFVTAGGLVAGAGAGSPHEVPSRSATLAMHETGAPPGYTGAPGEPTCHDCHNDLELNEPEGRLEVVGFPDAYDPGASYAVTVLLTSQGMERAGFQATASAGTLAALGPETTVFPDSLGRKQYVGHAAGHTRPESSERTRWVFEWTAPDRRGEAAALYVAANSANGDASPLNDFIYVTSRESR